jgi:hypothetical protein
MLSTECFPAVGWVCGANVRLVELSAVSTEKWSNPIHDN